MPRLLWLMFQVPMSSPQMTRMFGFLAGSCAGSCGQPRQQRQGQPDKFHDSHNSDLLGFALIDGPYSVDLVTIRQLERLTGLLLFPK